MAAAQVSFSSQRLHEALSRDSRDISRDSDLELDEMDLKRRSLRRKKLQSTPSGVIATACDRKLLMSSQSPLRAITDHCTQMDEDPSLRCDALDLEDLHDTSVIHQVESE